MKLEKAKILFDAGALMRADVVSAPMEGSGYLLEIMHRDGQRETLETARRSGARVFRTLDAAATTAAGIGFRQFWVHLV